jgi:D-2-hydroxyacid dehydrogenase (NADP+)
MRHAWSGDGRTTVLFDPSPGFDERAWTESLDELFPGWRGAVEARFPAKRPARRALLEGADVFVASWVTQDVLDRGRALRWVHVTMSGIDGVDALDVPERVRLTSTAGVAAAGMAEHALGLVIALARRFDRALDRQRSWSWSQEGVLEEIRPLAGRTLGIVGLGHSGRALARLGLALGMRVVGVSRRGAPVEGLDAVWTPDGLPVLLRESDFVVLCAPATNATEGLIGRRELEELGPDGFLVNVSRGELVDERALADALRDGAIAGAGLDVLRREPPPRRHPLRRAPNLVVTPHVAGNLNTYAPAIRAGFVAQLREHVLEGSS